MKQSQRTYLPQLNQISSLKAFVSNEFKEEELYIGHCLDEEQDSPQLSKEIQGKSALVLIGPEGDFSKEEVDMAIEKGFKPISLGRNRLRTETAGIAACHILALGQKYR